MWEPERLDVSVGATGIDLGVGSGNGEKQLLALRAAYEALPLVVDTTREGEIAGEFDLSDILNNRIEALEGTINVEVDEGIRRFDRAPDRVRLYVTETGDNCFVRSRPS